MQTATASVQEGRNLAIISADIGLLREVEQNLGRSFRLRLLDSWSRLAPLMNETTVDAVLLDLDTQGMPPENAVDLLTKFRSINKDLLLTAVTRSPERDIRLKAARVPVDEFFVAPIDFEVLHIVLQRALDKRTMELLAGRYQFSELIGSSEPMRRVYDAITRVANSDTSVVIRGESGTGKELVARAIVAVGPRRDKPFISLNCAALPPSLIESELFGHEKGAFTGADTARPGQIELAHEGTLFLDEIATLGLDLQSKLLRVLESHTVQRIGGRSNKQVNFRLLTATNENLEEMVRTGRFREDLYYRIHVVPIFLPPLRERREDIALLAEHFLHVYCAANRVPYKRLDSEALEVLEEHSWHGNVRELENVIQRLVLMVEGAIITAKDMPETLLYASTARRESLLIPDEGIDFYEEMARIEVAYLEAALRRSNGKKITAAALLHLKPQQIKYLCRKYNLGAEEAD